MVLRRKFGITVADARGCDDSEFSSETYSVAIESSSIRFTANANLGRTGGVTYNLDVKGAYFEGRKIPPEATGRRSL